MKQVDKISLVELKEMAKRMYGDMVKCVVDLQKRAVVFDAEMHVDEEQYLLEHGSGQNDLWGFNVYPDRYGKEDFIEFDSMINIRPRQKNMSRSVEDSEIRDKIKAIVNEVVHE